MQAPSRDRQDSNAHVLIVDDDPDNLRLLGTLLAENGYGIHVAESGERALSTLASMAQGAPIDLVLLDILMPGGMDGLETCRGIKAREDMRAIPVIFLTGKDDRETLLAAFEAGGADYVLRPFDPNVLLARVRAHSRLGRLSRDLESELSMRTLELRETNRLLAESNQRLRSLANEISLVEEREKQRLAAELHDSPMQKLSLAQMQIRSATKERDEESEQLLDSGLDLMREALAELRTLQFEISPPVLYQQGLAAALRWLAESMSQRFGIPLTFSESSPLLELESRVAILLFQCARELVFNLIKHAHASRGWLDLGCSDGMLTLRVADNGEGCVLDTSGLRGQSAQGFGLFAIRERLRLMDGELRFEMGAAGTVATISVPEGQVKLCREG